MAWHQPTFYRQNFSICIVVNADAETAKAILHTPFLYKKRQAQGLYRLSNATVQWNLPLDHPKNRDNLGVKDSYFSPQPYSVQTNGTEK